MNSTYMHKVVLGSLLACLAATPVGARADTSQDDLDSIPDRELQSFYIAGGMTAEQAAQRVLQVAPELDKARAQVKAAHAGAVRAWAAIVPQLDAQGSYTRLSDVNNSSLSGGDSAQTNMLISQLVDPAAQALWTGFTSFSFPVFLDRWSLNASLTYPLSRSLVSVLPTLRAAKRGEAGAEAGVEAEQLAVSLFAKQAFYDFVRAVAARGVAEKSLEQASSQYDQMKALLEGGAAARVDLLRVDAQRSAARVALAKATQDVYVTERTLQTLLDSDQAMSVGEDLSAPVAGIPAGDQASLEATALAERPDLIALRALRDAKVLETRGAKGARYPELILQANVEYSNPNSRIIPSVDEFRSSWDVSAVIRWSPNETVDASGQTKQRSAELQQAEADLLLAEDGVRVEVARGYRGVSAAQEALEAARLGLVAAAEGYRVSRAQLEAGVIDTTDLLVAEADLTRARLELIGAAIGLRLAKESLIAAIGGVRTDG